MANRYRSKPTEIEAVQWDGSLHCLTRLEAWAGDEQIRLHGVNAIQLLAGQDGAQDWVPVPVGHWIVRKPGDPSDYWPVDPEHFASKYEPVPSGEGDTDG